MGTLEDLAERMTERYCVASIAAEEAGLIVRGKGALLRRDLCMALQETLSYQTRVPREASGCTQRPSISSRDTARDDANSSNRGHGDNFIRQLGGFLGAGDTEGRVSRQQ